MAQFSCGVLPADNGMTTKRTRVEAGSNTSTVTLRVVEGETKWEVSNLRQ
jgi:hypothetical protein